MERLSGGTAGVPPAERGRRRAPLLAWCGVAGRGGVAVRTRGMPRGEAHELSERWRDATPGRRCWADDMVMSADDADEDDDDVDNVANDVRNVDEGEGGGPAPAVALSGRGGRESRGDGRGESEAEASEGMIGMLAWCGFRPPPPPVSAGLERRRWLGDAPNGTEPRRSPASTDDDDGGAQSVSLACGEPFDDEGDRARPADRGTGRSSSDDEQKEDEGEESADDEADGENEDDAEERSDDDAAPPLRSQSSLLLSSSAT